MDTDNAFVQSLQNRLPLRMFASLPKQDFDSTDYLRSVEHFVQCQTRNIFVTALPETETPPMFVTIAVQIWGSRILIIFDINHDAYNSKTAHHPLNNDLPVFRFTLNKHGKRATITRDKALDERVNWTIASVHRRNSIDTHPPYFEDHSPGADPIQYTAPRQADSLS